MPAIRDLQADISATEHKLRFFKNAATPNMVVKNLEANYRRVNDISGATIMGDGRVALILDTGSLVRRTRH